MLRVQGSVREFAKMRGTFLGFSVIGVLYMALPQFVETTI